MSDEIRIAELGLKPGVLERIVTLAAKQVEGVASICGQSIVQKNQAAKGVEVEVASDGAVSVAIHVQSTYGKPIQDIGHEVQAQVAEAIRSQVGAQVAAVDVYVDDIVFDA